MSKTFETPKGTRDFLPDEMRLRRQVFSRLERAFCLFGYDELDTPAFEYLETLTLKSGPQAEREIYSFLDKGDRRLGLRFDLTASTGRVMASHPEIKRPVYRYQVGKVWRYDRPAAGRYREFYQADADIIGSYSMDCEIELLQLGIFVLEDFGLEDCYFFVNHRQILDAHVRLSGITPDKKSDALRALDKLDKLSREAVVEEALRYGVDKQAFETFLNRLGIDDLRGGAVKDSFEYLRYLEGELSQDETGTRGVKELRFIIEKANDLGLASRVQVHPMLARGLDYYTGPIFEARATTGEGLLSFAGGGRYDDLIELYGGQAQGAVGFSFGVERLISLIKEKSMLTVKSSTLFVVPVGVENFVAAEDLAMQLRRANIAVRVAVKDAAVGKQIQYANAAGFTEVVLVGEREVKSGRYVLKQLEQQKELLLTVDELVQHMKRSA